MENLIFCAVFCNIIFAEGDDEGDDEERVWYFKQANIFMIWGKELLFVSYELVNLLAQL